MTIRCSRCGAEIPDGTAGCPACLLALAFADGSIGPAADATVSAPSYRLDGRAGARLAPGEHFGPYRIERLLGVGGMGEVYDAEHLEHGRRVALKVLKQGAVEEADRHRFLREGQLAASVVHPNSVYLYGSEEIAGTAVISMELLAGGTLKDRVTQRGHLPVREAVDAILQVIAGLQAAQEVGVLHRDVKPSNCFVDADGTVKIGDFGLSISTLARDVTQLTRAGTFHGTPQFAPPEQIKGEPLDVRADIYAVGATLYYLLTAHAPFEDRDLLALVARVMADDPRAPAAYQPAIPRELARLVLRCLRKRPDDRPAGYAELADRLIPYSSAVPEAAALGPRIAAGAIDLGVVFTAQSVARLFVWVPTANWMPFLPRDLWLIAGFAAAYVALGDRLPCSTFGKALCGLKVVDRRGAFPTLAQTIVRGTVFTAALFLPITVNGGWFTYYRAFMSFMAMIYPRWSRILNAAVQLSTLMAIGALALFSTARRRNQFAGLHDLLSRTCVVSRRSAVRHLQEPRSASWCPPDAESLWIGPYCADPAGQDMAAPGFVAAIDTRLRRRVWIHHQPVGTPFPAANRRQLSRPTRLRWLNGRRTGTECWDAYEAPEGRPLARLLDRHHSWDGARVWLYDLALECAAAEGDQTLPAAPALSQLWVTDHGRLKVLDTTGDAHPATGTLLESPANAVRAVNRLAVATLGEASSVRQPPLAVHARTLLEDLQSGRFSDPAAISARLHSVANRPGAVSRRHRAQLLICAAILPLFAVVWGIGFVGSSIFYAEHEASVDSLRNVYEGTAPRATIDLRPALEVYVSSNSGDAVAPADVAAFCRDPLVLPAACAYRITQQRARASQPEPTRLARARAVADLEPLLRPTRGQYLRSSFWHLSRNIADAMTVSLVWSLIALALFRRTPLQRLLRVAIVGRDGRPASVGRRLVRWTAVWSPALPIATFFSPDVAFRVAPWIVIWWPIEDVMPVTLLLMTAGAIEAFWHPSRSLADRVAGTWLVPE